MRKRTTYYNFDKEVVDAVDNALDTCLVGDGPDITVEIISTLKMNGWDIVKKERQND